MKKTLIAICLLLFPLLLTAAPVYEEELHYFPIIPEQPGGEGGRIQVMGFFWYGCGHCYKLDPHLNKWLENKPEDVDFVHVPAMFNRPHVVMHAKTFYALKLMGVAGELHEKIFHAILDENRYLKTQGEMEEFLSEHNVDLDAYRKAMRSFAVQTQARRAAVLADHFDVQGVPAIVVDGKYLTSGLKGDAMVDVTGYLIDRVRKEKATNAAK